MRSKTVFVIETPNMPSEKIHNTIITSSGCGFKRYKNYVIVKLVFDSDNDGLTAIYLTLYMRAQFVFDIDRGKFGGFSVLSDTTRSVIYNTLSPSLQAIFAPVLHLYGNDVGDESLFGNFNTRKVSEAIYLTDKKHIYKEKLDHLEYQLIRYQYGRPIQGRYKESLILKYPEELI